MSITFGGLATGLDTNSIINQLMNIERAPIVRMEADKTWLNNRLSAFTSFDAKLNSFLNAAEDLGNLDKYGKKIATTSSQEYFLATASEDAIPNVSYTVEVENLATVQKSYTQTGFASSTDQDFGTGNLVINVDGTDHIIEITESDNYLTGIMQAINEADIGVSASIINDGLANPYHLTLTGTDVGTSFTVDESGLSGGTETLGTIITTQPATQAHIIVDGIDIFSDANSISDAIPGVTLDLTKAETGTETTVNIKENNSAISSNLNAFVKGYNEVISFITSQSTMGGTEGGVLGGDSGLNSIKRHLQDMLTTRIGNSGSFSALTHLGLETQKNGTLNLNSSVLDNALKTDLDSVISMLAGTEDGETGIAEEFTTYLEGLTNSSNGVLAGRRQSINTNIDRIDVRIESATMRLEQREKTIRAQFNAMEELVSVMNAESTFLSQQMESISNLRKS